MPRDIFCVFWWIIVIAGMHQNVEQTKDLVTHIPEHEKKAKVMFSHDVTLYKQQWCEDGYFLPAICMCSTGNLSILHITSLQQLGIIIRDKRSGILYCEHEISSHLAPFSDNEFLVNNGDYYRCSMSWHAENADGRPIIFRIIWKRSMGEETIPCITSNCVTALNEAKKLAHQYKEKFELQETLRQELLNQLETSNDKPENCSMYDSIQSESTDVVQSDSSTCSDSVSQSIKTDKHQSTMNKILLSVENLTQACSDVKILVSGIAGNVMQESHPIPGKEERKSVDGQFKEMKAQVEELQTYMKEKDSKIQELTVKLKDFTEMETNIASKDLKIQELNAKIENLNQLQHDKDLHIQELNDKELTFVWEKNLKIQQLTSTVENLNKMCKEKECKIKDLTAKVYTLTQCINVKELEMQTMTNKIKEVTENKDLQIIGLTCEVNELKEVVKQMQQKIDEKDLNIQESNIFVDEKIERGAIISKNLQGEIETKDSHIKYMTEKIQQLEDEKKLMEYKIYNQVEIFKQEIHYFKNDQENLKKRCTDKRSEILKLKNTVQELQSEVSVKNVEIIKYNHQIKFMLSQSNIINLDNVYLTPVHASSCPISNFIKTWECELIKQGVPEGLWVNTVVSKALQGVASRLYHENRFDTQNWHAFTQSLIQCAELLQY